MWEGLRDSEQNPNIDKKYGQKGLYKKVKVNAKEVLEEASRNVEAGEKGREEKRSMQRRGREEKEKIRRRE